LSKYEILEIVEKSSLPNKITARFWIGDKELVDKKDIEKYKELEEKGLITLDSVGKSFLSGIYYRISLTDKANEYIETTEDKKDRQTAEQKEIDRLLGEEKAKRELVTVRVATIRITEVKDIHEIPSENRAQAKIVLEAENKTPFWLLNKDTTTIKERKISFIKTTEGWTLDN
jgi:hypothetical protein